MKTSCGWIVIFLVLAGCAGQQNAPALNPSPLTRFTIEGNKSADIEAHFEVLHAASEDHCSIDRPGSNNVRRTQRGKRQSIAAGDNQFRVEFFLDEYLPGDCRWHASSIEFSVNRPPYNGLVAGWSSLVSFELWAGTQGIDELVLVCAPETTSARALTCKGPLANADGAAGKLSIKIISDSSATR